MGGSDCELIGAGWLAQPANAWSSGAYLVAAAFVLGRRHRAGTTPPAVVVAGVVALALVSLGSIAYHGPQPSWAGPLHNWSITALLLVLAAPVLVAVTQGRRRGRPRAAPDLRLRVAVPALGTGLVLYVLGRTGGPLCWPTSPLQAHAGWHVLTAVAAAVVLSAGPGRAHPGGSLMGPPRPSQ